MGKYAEGTSVPVDRSRAEIESVVRKYGADQMNSGWTTDKAVIMFRLSGKYIRIDMPLAVYGVALNRYRRRLTQDQVGQENRRRWRAMVLYIKAKLEGVDSGIVSMETAFMAHILLPNKQTVGEFMSPQISGAYESGEMPKQLPGW